MFLTLSICFSRTLFASVKVHYPCCAVQLPSIESKRYQVLLIQYGSFN